MTYHSRPSIRSPKRQEGVVLIIAIIALVIMTIAGIALVRSTDTGIVIAGNVAFRQAALQESDVGVDAAFRALSDALGPTYIGNKATDMAPRYYATTQTLNASGAPSVIDSMSPSDAVGSSDVYPSGVGPNGNRVRFVIERLCNMVPPSPPAKPSPKIPATEAEIKANCVTYAPSAVSNSSRTALRIKLGAVSMPSIYYRITIRVDGPRNTVSTAQSIVRI